MGDFDPATGGGFSSGHPGYNFYSASFGDVLFSVKFSLFLGRSVIIFALAVIVLKRLFIFKIDFVLSITFFCLAIFIVTIIAAYSDYFVIGISLYIHAVEIVIYIVFIVSNDFEKLFKTIN